MGHPNCAQSASSSAASCCCASPWGAISLSSAVFVRPSQWLALRVVHPVCVVHWPLMRCSRRMLLRSCLFCLRSSFVVAPVAIFPVVLMTGGCSSSCPRIVIACGSAAGVLSTLISMSLSPGASAAISSHLPCPLSSRSLGSTLPSPLIVGGLAFLLSRCACMGSVFVSAGTCPLIILLCSRIGLESRKFLVLFSFRFLAGRSPALCSCCRLFVAPRIVVGKCSMGNVPGPHLIFFRPPPVACQGCCSSPRWRLAGCQACCSSPRWRLAGEPS